MSFYAQGVGQSLVMNTGTTLPSGSYTLSTLPGYTWVPLAYLPTSFTLTQTSTGNAWTWNSAANQLRDGNWGGDPTVSLAPSQPGDIFSGWNAGLWMRLLSTPGNAHVRHGGYVMFLQGYVAANFDYAWAVFLKNGTKNQVKIWNPFGSVGVGSWVQSGAQTGYTNASGRIAINTADPLQAHIYTITPSITFPAGRSVGSGPALINQLSSTAAGALTGAFSLRAIYNTLALAINVRRSSDNATQNFWTDRLGNLFTIPIKGISLRDWLGSDTGYVTAWYDQTPLGNHMFASIQPIINTSTKPAYLTFSGTEYFQNISPFTTDFGSGTFTVRYVVSNNTGGVIIYKADTPDFVFSAHEKEFLLGDGSPTIGNRGGYPFFVGSGEGSTVSSSAIGSSKTSVVHKATSTTTVPTYINGTNQTLSIDFLFMSTDPGNYLYFGTGAVGPSYIGNIHEIQIFNKDLNDTDRTLLENY